MRRESKFAVLALLVATAPASACSLCGDVLNRQTLRLEARRATLVLYGTLANARLGTNGSGFTDLTIEEVIKDNPARAGKQTITIPRYLPASPSSAPPKYLVFCDVYEGKLDPYRGTPVKGPAVVDYVKKALALNDQDRIACLKYHFQFIDNADPELATDAFIEFAKANDREIGIAGPQLQAEKIRKLLLDPQTPPERLGLYAYLLGACGHPSDADLLAGMLAKPTERTMPTYGGQLAGYIQLQPRAGWDFAVALLKDPKRPAFPDKLAVLGTLRFIHGSRPTESRGEVLKAYGELVEIGELADLAVEDLRRWHLWDLTPGILAQFGKPSHDAPLVRRAIVRFALCSPSDDARQFVAKVRAQDRELVADLEESLRLEGQQPPT